MKIASFVNGGHRYYEAFWAEDTFFLHSHLRRPECKVLGFTNILNAETPSVARMCKIVRCKYFREVYNCGRCFSLFTHCRMWNGLVDNLRSVSSTPTCILQGGKKSWVFHWRWLKFLEDWSQWRVTTFYLVVRRVWQWLLFIHSTSE